MQIFTMSLLCKDWKNSIQIFSCVEPMGGKNALLSMCRVSKFGRKQYVYCILIRNFFSYKSLKTNQIYFPPIKFIIYIAIFPQVSIQKSFLSQIFFVFLVLTPLPHKFMWNIWLNDMFPAKKKLFIGNKT